MISIYSPRVVVTDITVYDEHLFSTSWFNNSQIYQFMMSIYSPRVGSTTDKVTPFYMINGQE